MDELVRSYDGGRNINHLSKRQLPSRAEVESIVDDLLALVFPGFFGAQARRSDDLPWLAAERATRVTRELEALLMRALPLGQSPCQPGLDATSSDAASELALSLVAAIPAIRDIVDVDVQATYAGDPAAGSAEEIITSYPGVLAVTVHRLAHHLYLHGVPLLPRMMSEVMHSKTGIDIHPGATIGRGFVIDHGTGVVVGETCKIGDFVTIYQGVTLGALSIKADAGDRECGEQRHPTLGDRVTVYAGATILGGDTLIGEGCIIGGNVWLTHSVPAWTTVVLDRPSVRISPRSRTTVDEAS